MGAPRLVKQPPGERAGRTDGPRDQELDALVGAIPEGWSRARIAGHLWGVTRTTRAEGRVISISAERLSDAEQLGANVWITPEGAVLRPCEVSEEKVMQFLRAAVTASTWKAGTKTVRCSVISGDAAAASDG